MNSNDFCNQNFEGFGGKISFIITDVVQELLNRGSNKIEGIFRERGNELEINQLFNDFNKGRINDFSKFDSHSIATFLKKYLQSHLTFDPLFPPEIISQLLIFVNLDDENFIKNTKELFEKLSFNNFITISYLFTFFEEIIKYESLNKMNIYNLSSMIAPNIFPEPKNSKDLQNFFISIIPMFTKIFTHKLIFFSNSFDYFSKFILKNEEINLIIPKPISIEVIESFFKSNKIQNNSFISFIPNSFLNLYKSDYL